MPSFFSALFVPLIVGAFAYVIWPSENCKRIDHASNLIYGSLGIIPWTGENLIKTDMTKTWYDVENASKISHEFISNYFQLNCQAPAYTLYGKELSKREGAQWMNQNDEELYKMIERN